MKALITGATGQLGRELARHAPGEIEVLAVSHADLDIADGLAVSRFLDAERAAVVLNAAGYTAVDRAEREPALAHAANAIGPGILARECAKRGARLVHVSSDYVFSGTASRPYQPGDPAEPVSAYGRSKREGEVAVLEADPRAVVVRSAWLHSAAGTGFVQVMLRKAREAAALRVVADQVGSPTWAAGLASVIWQVARRADVVGIIHHVDAGVASWYDFAVALFDEAVARGLIASMPPIEPITTPEYPTPARRPAFSVLDAGMTRHLLGNPAVHWRENLRRMFDEMAAERARSPGHG